LFFLRIPNVRGPKRPNFENISVYGEGQLQLKVSSLADPKWDDYLESLDGNIYHSNEWAKTNITGHEQPLFFSWFEGDQCIALAVGIKRWSLVPVVGRFIKHLSFESYPIVADNSRQVLEKILQQLKDHARKEGYLSLAINSFFTDAATEDFEKIGYDELERIQSFQNLQ